jgi:hypothetical protein
MDRDLSLVYFMFTSTVVSDNKNKKQEGRNILGKTYCMVL